jgi:hypothetical protein
VPGSNTTVQIVPEPAKPHWIEQLNGLPPHPEIVEEMKLQFPPALPAAYAWIDPDKPPPEIVNVRSAPIPSGQQRVETRQFGLAVMVNCQPSDGPEEGVKTIRNGDVSSTVRSPPGTTDNQVDPEQPGIKALTLPVNANGNPPTQVIQLMNSPQRWGPSLTFHPPPSHTLPFQVNGI